MGHSTRPEDRQRFQDIVASLAIGLVALLGLAGLGTLLAGATGFSVFRHLSRDAGPAVAAAPDPDLDRIAIPYFLDAPPGEGLRPIADGLTESLIDQLSHADGLYVLSRGAVRPYRGRRAPLDSLRRALGAGTVVAGSIEQVGDRVHVVVRLVDARSGGELSRSDLSMPSSQLLTAVDSVVAATARQLRALLGREIDVPGTRLGTGSLGAWTLYLRAEAALRQADAAASGGSREDAGAAFDRADSLLSVAKQLDPWWAAPPALQADLAYRRSRHFAPDPDKALHWIDVGLERAAEALSLDAENARAIAARGTLEYWHWLLDLLPDEERSEALFHQARADLERAVELDPHLASAYATLSHLYLEVPDREAALRAGRKAYEEDPYQENADAVVRRLVSASFDLGQFHEMARWCRTGRERFPDDFHFVDCSLQLMTTPADRPDIERAWSLLARLDSLVPESQARGEHLRGEMTVGGIIGRTGDPDSASAVLDRAHARISPDMRGYWELYIYEARVRAGLGDAEGAIDLLEVCAAANPDTSFDEDGWWRVLRGNSRWQELLNDS